MNSFISPLSSQESSAQYQSNETKLCVIIDERTPIIIKVPIAPTDITLAQFKQITSLESSNYKFYFKSQDAEFGVVKEEVLDDFANLPTDGDRIVAWVISVDNHRCTLFRDERDMNLSLYSQPHRSVQQSIDKIYIDVILELSNFNFLGLTLVGPSTETSVDRGIYVGEIADNSVCQQDGRVEIGDQIIKINGLDVSGMDNDKAVAVFRECVQRRGKVTLVLLRNLGAEGYKKGRFTLPREYANTVNKLTCQRHYQSGSQINSEQIPIPVHHSGSSSNTSRYRKPDLGFSCGFHSLPRSITPRSLYTASNSDNNRTDLGSNHLKLDSRSAYEPSTPTLIRHFDIPIHCARDDIQTVYNALRNDLKSLDIKDREWLKVIIKDAFLGSSLVKWLQRNVYGFCHKREVKRYANRLLAEGFIRDPMTSGSFSEKCYYTL